MPQFISDEDMAKMESAKPGNAPGGTGFISDEEMSKMESAENQPWYAGPVKGITESLPVAGMMLGGAGGGLLGTAAFGIGAVPGALSGAAAGTGLGYAAKNLIEATLLNEPKTRAEIYGDPLVRGPLEGVAAEAGGLALSKGAELAAPYVSKGIGAVPNKVKSLLRPAKDAVSDLFQPKEVQSAVSEAPTFLPKKNANTILDASKRLDLPTTPGQLTSDPYVQNIQSSLEQSPSYAGKLMRDQTMPVVEGLKNKTKEVLSDATSLQRSEIGRQIKEDITNVVQQTAQVPKQIFENVQQSTKFIDVNPVSLNKVANNIRSIHLAKFKGSTEEAFAKQFSDMLEQVRTVDDLKQLGTIVGKRFNSVTEGSTEEAILSSVYGKVRNLEKNTILREAIKQARTGPEGAKLGKQLITDLSSAREMYKGIFDDLGVVGKGSGLQKGAPKTIEQFLNRLDQVPDEQLTEKLFRTGNRGYLEKLKTMFPDSFDKLRQSYVADILKKSMDGENISFRKFLGSVKSLEPQTKELIFGADNAETIKNLETVINSLPKKIGASDTPRGIEWMHYLDPRQWPGEIARLKQYRMINTPVTMMKDVGPRPISSAAKTFGQGLLSGTIQQSVKGR